MNGIMDKMWWNLKNMGWTPTTSKRAAALLERKAKEEGLKIYTQEHHQTIYIFTEDED